MPNLYRYNLSSAHTPLMTESGSVSPAWLRFFNWVAQGPQKASSVTLTGSPFSFACPSDGALVVSGGTVSSITLTRATVATSLGVTQGHFTAAIGDIFKITYTVAPNVTFFPA